MGNTGSSGNGRRRNSHHHHHHHHHPPSPPPPLNPQQAQEIPANRLYAYTPSYPPTNHNPNAQHYYQYTAFYPPAPPSMPVPLPAPFDNHHRGDIPEWAPPVVGGRYPMPPVSAPSPAPYVEHQKAVTIRNDINLKKETLRVEPDEQNPGRFLVAFTFDATVAGSITVLFFAKEEVDCNLVGTKESLGPITVYFKEGLGQKFRQPCGSGIDFSMFDKSELTVEGDTEVYPLAVKAEASLSDPESAGENESTGTPNSQITQAMFVKKENGDYQVRVLKQILWVNGTRYELQEIYGIGNSVEGDFDGNDPGKECVICLSEPRDTAVLPCRHMCMCSGCAKVLRFQTNRCPICRQPVDRLLEIKVNRAEEQNEAEN